jgi:hypothetical protein
LIGTVFAFLDNPLGGLSDVFAVRLYGRHMRLLSLNCGVGP